MILINLLPPELRRRQSGVSPVFASVVGGGIACLLLVILYSWIQFVCIPNAIATKAKRDEELAAKTALADAVREMEKKIDENRQRRNKFYSLLAKKVYWARTLDEFANLLNGPWSLPGFDVRCTDLNITEAPGAGGGRGPVQDETVAFSVRWNYKLIGKERIRAGDYINSFFSTIKNSKFWKSQGFTGKPEETYRGDTPRTNQSIQRMIIEGTLEWQRVKVIKDKILAGR
jgi:Tfp pilus assembly protein PilN